MASVPVPVQFGAPTVQSAAFGGPPGVALSKSSHSGSVEQLETDPAAPPVAWPLSPPVPPLGLVPPLPPLELVPPVAELPPDPLLPPLPPLPPLAPPLPPLSALGASAALSLQPASSSAVSPKSRNALMTHTKISVSGPLQNSGLPKLGRSTPMALAKVRCRSL